LAVANAQGYDSGMYSLDSAALVASGLVAMVEHHPALASTNDRARELSGTAGATLPALIVADLQTAGRGRGVNRWWTGHGSLACSLLFDPATRGLERRLAPQLSLAAAVGVIDAVRAFSPPDAPLGLHWPNDVYLAEGKLAGILVEALADGRHVLGIGINTNNSLADAPADVRSRAISLRDFLARPVDHTRLLSELLTRFWGNLDALASGDDLARRYEELCAQVGRELTIAAAERRTTGRCLGIAPDGALRLQVAGREERFYGGVLVR
jgi:BirA family transcriptional regulator, biotin operon repressor / biotin---[acetyl-CoA-carboxylase] ligase